MLKMFSYDGETSGTNAGAWIEVDLDAISYNYDTVRSIVGEDTRICSVVKADAYGHGVYEVARLLEQKGVDYFAVAVLDEGIDMRKSGISKPILIFSPLLPQQVYYVLRYNLTQTITSYEMAKELSDEAVRQGQTAKVHVKVDTGMGRIGVSYRHAVSLVKSIISLPNLEIEGIYTHFSTSDSEDKSFTIEQWNRFNEILDCLKKEGINIPIAHAATSSAVIDLPYMKLDMVRTGLMTYGLYPGSNMREKIELRPALTLKAKISYLKEIEERMSISYGRNYYADKGEKIATLPVGYYDGFRRLLTNNSEVLVHGKRCPVVGNVCMDHIMVNVSQCEQVKEFDEAVVIGKQGNDEIPVDEMAKKLSTINYEIISSLGRRIPRIYLRNGQITAVRNLFGYHTTTIIPADREAAGVVEKTAAGNGMSGTHGNGRVKKSRRTDNLVRI
jgi:alanine racemase